jgi:hypothetical protein
VDAQVLCHQFFSFRFVCFPSKNSRFRVCCSSASIFWPKFVLNIQKSTLHIPFHAALQDQTLCNVFRIFFSLPQSSTFVRIMFGSVLIHIKYIGAILGELEAPGTDLLFALFFSFVTRETIVAHPVLQHPQDEPLQQAHSF